MLNCPSCGKVMRMVGETTILECHCDPMRRIMEKEASAKLKDERDKANAEQRRLNQLKRRLRVQRK